MLNIDKTLVNEATEDILLVAGYIPPASSTAYGGSTPVPFHILGDELEVRANGRPIMIMGDLNARVGTLVDTAPSDLFEGLEHFNLPIIEMGQGVNPSLLVGILIRWSTHLGEISSTCVETRIW